MIRISPSLLAADWANLQTDIAKIETSADWLHLDVMDANFVPNMSMGPQVVEAIRHHSKLFFDVHLMILDPAKYADTFIDAGADLICFHIEALENPEELIAHIKSRNVKVALAVSPDTPAERIYKYLKDVDMILVMTVYPGFGGQKMIPAMADKIKAIRTECNRLGLDTLIEVDGGIGAGNVALLSSAGANVIVAGSSVFKAQNPAGAVAELRAAAENI